MQNGKAQKPEIEDNRPWYAGVTRYEWLVLIIASAGWVFDVYESQAFAITRNQMLHEIVGSNSGDVKNWGDILFAVFLLGGTVGGLAAGSLADRYGRRPVLMLTILLYSIFSGLTFLAANLWQVAVLRFLVAIGVGGEWAVAASLVAEVFPMRARAHASGIFHASSILGTWMAGLVGMAIGAQWRYAYLFGIAPALLILWVRARVREPEVWQTEAKNAVRSPREGARLGSFRSLLFENPWSRHALLGVALAGVGLGTFWAITVAGQNLAQEMLQREGVVDDRATEQAKFAYSIVETTGGGLGLLAFGPLSARFGRRRTFITFQLLAFVIVPITCFAPQTYHQLLLLLPIFGFLTLAIHAGYAIYFPELFPTSLRATGASFCFNGGRVLAGAVLILSGWLKALPGMDLRWAMTYLSSLFLLGVVLMFFLPETNHQELPE
ncbi:MAG TPA: MFS transporter [Lacipirellulaceae bacterium]|nr:MFS transporter [Lacipirellulaceae bacterium]